MRKVWLLASALLAFLNFVKSQEVARTLYSTRYDNLDIDTILASNRLVTNYVDCLLSRKPCPPEGKDLKRILPEALRTKCARCSPIQKENALKIITRLYYEYPDQYRALRERWDPSGEYHRRFEEYLRGLQFNQIGGNGGPSGGGSNTVESGGNNDRPVRNDLDRQPATQSSNVQTIVIDPTLAGQPIGNVNTFPGSPPTSPAAVTERPRPPAPVAQILFPTTTNNTPTTTISTSASNFGPLELTSSAPANNVTSSGNLVSPSGGTGLAASPSDPSLLLLPSAPDAVSEQDSTVTAGPVVPVPIPQELQWPLDIINSTTTTFGQSVQPTTQEEVSAALIPGLGAQLALQIPDPVASSRPVVVDREVVGEGGEGGGTGYQNWGTAGNGQQLPLASMYGSVPTTAEPVEPRPTSVDDGFDELSTASPPVVVNRFGDDDANGRPSVASVPAVPVVTTTTTPRPTTTVRQTRPVTRQSTTRNTQRTTTRFITRLPPTLPPTPPRTTTTTRTPTILPQRPPQYAPQPPAPAQQQPLLPPALPPQQYPTVVYERPPAPPRASPPLTTARPFYVQPEPPRTQPPPPPSQQYPTVVYQRPQVPPQAPLPSAAPPRPYYVQPEPPRTQPPPQQYPSVVYQVPQAPPAQAPPRPYYEQPNPQPPSTQYGQTTPDSIIDHFFVPPSSSQAGTNQPPIVGLWNQLGTKIADTADAIAGMLKKTVDVLVTSHIQSHQRALRRIQ